MNKFAFKCTIKIIIIIDRECIANKIINRPLLYKEQPKCNKNILCQFCSLIKEPR